MTTRTMQAINEQLARVGESVSHAIQNCVWARLSDACEVDDWPDDTEVWVAVQSRLGLEATKLGLAQRTADIRVRGPFTSHMEAMKATGRMKPKTFIVGPISVRDLVAENKRLAEEQGGS